MNARTYTAEDLRTEAAVLHYNSPIAELKMMAGADAMDALAAAKLEMDQLRDRYEADLDKAGERIEELEANLAEALEVNAHNEAWAKLVKGKVSMLEAARRELDAILDWYARPGGFNGEDFKGFLGILDAALARREAARNAAKEAQDAE